jgi:hypothetical protein
MVVISRKLVVALASLLAAPTAMAGPSMSWGWAPISDEAECMRTAEDVVKKQGFNTNFSVSKSSVFGVRDEYTAVIDCLASNRLVFFVVAGPDLNKANKYENALQSSGY